MLSLEFDKKRIYKVAPDFPQHSGCSSCWLQWKEYIKSKETFYNIKNILAISLNA